MPARLLEDARQAVPGGLKEAGRIPSISYISSIYVYIYIYTHLLAMYIHAYIYIYIVYTHLLINIIIGLSRFIKGG